MPWWSSELKLETDEGEHRGFVPIAVGQNEVSVESEDEDAGEVSFLLRVFRHEPLRLLLPWLRPYEIAQLSVLFFLLSLIVLLRLRLSILVAAPLLALIPISRVCPELPLIPRSLRPLSAGFTRGRQRGSQVGAGICLFTTFCLLLLLRKSRAEGSRPAWFGDTLEVDCSVLPGEDCSGALKDWAGRGNCAILAETEGDCNTYCRMHGRTCVKSGIDDGRGACVLARRGRQQRQSAASCSQERSHQLCVCSGQGEAPRAAEAFHQAEPQPTPTTTRPRPEQAPAPLPEPRPSEEPLPFCFRSGIKYEPLNMPRMTPSTTADAIQCQVRCARAAGCARFTWIPRADVAWPGVATKGGSCHLQDSRARPKPATPGTISGLRDCDEEIPAEAVAEEPEAVCFGPECEAVEEPAAEAPVVAVEEKGPAGLPNEMNATFLFIMLAACIVLAAAGVFD